MPSTAAVAPLTRAQLGLVVVLHLAQALFLFWHAWTTDFAHDANYYLRTADALMRDGLAYTNEQAGYRSYFVPLLFGVLREVPAPIMPGSGHSLPGVLALCFVLISIAVSVHVLRRESLGRWALFAVPTLFNPMLLGHVPILLQESVLVLIAVPLLVVLMAVRQRPLSRQFVLAAAIACLIFIIRGSMFWMAVPLVLYVWMLARQTALGSRALVMPKAWLASAAIAIALVAPESWYAWQRQGTLNPYPSDAVARDQMWLGIDILKYATIRREGVWRGLWYTSPYTQLPREEKTLSFYWRHPNAGAFLIAAHVWTGLHYDVLATYFDRDELRIVSVWLILSALLVALGVLGLWRLLLRRDDPPLTALLVSMFVLSCGYTAFVATETRFGLFGFLAVSLGAAQLFASRAGRRRAWSAVPLVAAYVAACVAFQGTMIHSANIVREDGKVFNLITMKPFEPCDCDKQDEQQ
jgi:hypothetical protein